MNTKDGELPTCQVYVLLHPDTQEPFYVGMGKPGRAFSHVPAARRLTRQGKQLAGRHLIIQELLECNKLPITKILHEGLTKEQARRLEIKLIAKLGRRDLGTGPLTNRTKGGEWINDCPRTPEWLERMSASQRRVQNTEEVKALKSKALRGQKRTPDQVENIRQGQVAISEKVSLARRGSGNPAAKRCIVNGIEYGSLTDAAIALGLGDRPWQLGRKFAITFPDCHTITQKPAPMPTPQLE